MSLLFPPHNIPPTNKKQFFSNNSKLVALQLAEEVADERAVKVCQLLIDARRSGNSNVRRRLTAFVRIITEHKAQQQTGHYLQTTSPAFVGFKTLLFNKTIGLTDLVKVLHPTQRRIGHFGDVLPRQSLGLVLEKN